MHNFSDIKFFDEAHRYELDQRFIPSVSSRIALFYKPFDPKISRYVAKAKGVSEQVIKDEWKKTNTDAIELGKNTHEYAENFVKNVSTELPVLEPQNAFIKWLSNIDTDKYNIYFVEQPVYSRLYWFAGTPDLVLFNKINETYEIVDYKTNKDLFKNYKSAKLLYPFNDMLDTPINKYKIQLSHYQIALEEHGYKVSDRRVVWLPRDGNFQEFFLEDLSEQIKTYYDTEYRSI